MYSDVVITPELEGEYIEKVAKKIYEYDMETAAILFLESSKPLVWLGGEFGRFFITPFVPIINDEWGVTSEKFFLIFEKRENVEKLLKRLEALVQEEDAKKKEEKQTKKKLNQAKVEETEPSMMPVSDKEQAKTEKKGWRKYLP